MTVLLPLLDHALNVDSNYIILDIMWYFDGVVCPFFPAKGGTSLLGLQKAHISLSHYYFSFSWETRMFSCKVCPVKLTYQIKGTYRPGYYMQQVRFNNLFT